MQGSVIRCGLLAAVLGSTANSFGLVLYDAHGFEPSSNPAINYTQTYLQGQPAAAGNDQWANAPANSQPIAAVYATGLTSGNTQLVETIAQNVPSANPGFWYPQTYTTNAYVPAAGQGIAVTWAMSASSYQANLNNNAFIGIVAYGNDVNNNNVEIGRAGVDTTTGQISGGDVTVSPFTETADTYYNYEMLMNFTTGAYSIFTAPVGATSASDYTLRRTGSFENPAVSFTDADIATFSLQGPLGANFTAYGLYDNYVVQTVSTPEPASMGVAAVALGLLAARRKRA